MLNPAWTKRLRLCTNLALVSWLILGAVTVVANARFNTSMPGEEIITAAFVVIAVPLFFKGLSCVITGK